MLASFVFFSDSPNSFTTARPIAELVTRINLARRHLFDEVRVDGFNIGG
jgi:hypothetical protein